LIIYQIYLSYQRHFIIYEDQEIQMKRMVFVLIFAAMLTGSLFAQYIVKDTYFEVNGVSNQGIVSGYEGQAGPYLLWNPETDAVQNIGGVAPGNGVGGVARFSASANYISGTNYTEIPVSTAWTKQTLADYNFIFKSIEFPAAGGGFVGYAGGQSVTYMGDGIVLKTNNGGSSWSPMWTDEDSRGIEAMSFPTDITGYVCGWSDYFAKTSDGGWSWTPQDPAGTVSVYIYTGVAFKDELNGVVTTQLDNGMGVYVTSDGGETWTPGTGLTSIPSKIIYVSGDTYYLVNSGQMQKSTDNGLTWTTVHTFPGSLLIGLSFYNDMIGIILAEDNIFKTNDGGLTWTPQAVGPEVLWHDAAWIDASHIVICGTPDQIYESSNGGTDWTWANQATSTGDPALYDIAVTLDKVHVCGSQGTFYKRSTVSSATVADMARYDAYTQQWQQLGNLGFNVDGSTSSGWDISGDGLTVVGNSWAGPGYAHAVAWNAVQGLMDLGSMYPGASTRANAVDADGTVIVGWQDFSWKAAVWRKNLTGGYDPNQYLLIDPNGSPTDEFNQIFMAQAVSGNGNWIGGMGDFANNGDPWVWSESTGYVSLGHIDGGTGTVMGFNYDGTVAIGYFDMGFGNPRSPFIWTPADGLQNLNDWIVQMLGFSMGTTVIYTPMDISKNGRYIAGTGFDPMAGPWGEFIAFRLEIPNVGIDDNSIAPIQAALQSAYPNPFNPETTIAYSIEKAGKINIEIYNVKGQLVKTLLNEVKPQGAYAVKWNGTDDKGNAVSSGMYMYRMQTGQFTAAKKMMLVK
jgi:photosystem II stability/assembly factor-like uncharacterized protein